MTGINNSENKVMKAPLLFWASLILAAVFLTILYQDGLKFLLKAWESEEYSHGYLIPPIVAFLIWQKKDQLERVDFKGSWLGVSVVLLGILLYFVGELSSLYPIIHYSFLITIYGFLLAFMGGRAFKIIIMPLLILAFMIPLPAFIYNNLSAELQLISSQIGVAFIRLFDISVYLEGNVIDLGSYKLQVVEACSGLRYLFPLMTLGFIAAYFFKGAFWKRALIFLSSIPVTILLNSFRVGVIGIMVEYGGISMAEGFLHDFEGWVVFMACIAVLITEMWILAKIGKDRMPLHEAFGLDFPAPPPEDAQVITRKYPSQTPIALGILVVALLVSVQGVDKTQIIPDRTSFSRFPDEIGQWDGKQGRLDQIYLDLLALDDYLMTDFTGDDNRVINFYVAYYGSQSKGESAHSPRTCIPGGGWQIKELKQRTLDGIAGYDEPLKFNRLIIAKGNYKQLVYYWFQGRGRNITNEYMVKWYILWDALTKNRTDGALVRLTTMITPDEPVEIGDQRLAALARDIVPQLDPFIPR